MFVSFFKNCTPVSIKTKLTNAKNLFISQTPNTVNKSNLLQHFLGDLFNRMLKTRESFLLSGPRMKTSLDF